DRDPRRLPERRGRRGRRGLAAVGRGPGGDRPRRHAQPAARRPGPRGRASPRRDPPPPPARRLLRGAVGGGRAAQAPAPGAASMGQRALLAGVALALAVFVAFPLALLLGQAGDLGAAAGEIGPLLHTLLLVLGTVGLTWAVGVPVGLALARAPLPGWLVAA